MDELRGGGGHERGRHRRRSEHRLFDYGDLRLLLLSLIAEKPSHGYELIKAIEDQFGGGYSPSPGVIYPTLSWLDDMGYATIEAEGGRKSYSITAEGAAFLASNKAAIDDIKARGGAGGREDFRSRGRFGEVPVGVLRAMENLRTAMKLRLKKGPVDEAGAQAIAAALDAAAQAVERS